MTMTFHTFPHASHPVESTDVHSNRSYCHVAVCGRRGEAPDCLCCPRSIAIDSATNYIYVAEGRLFPDFAKISIFSESGEYINSYTDKCMKSLWGIAIHGDNMYVTDFGVNAVFLLKLEPNIRPVVRLGGLGSKVGQFDGPCQLSVSIDGDVYIADSNNDRIQIIESSMQRFKQLTHPSLHKPCDVKLTTEEIYVLSYMDSSCVHVFSLNGHKIRSLITRGDGLQTRCPVFFDLDISKSVVISDNGAHEIKTFSNEGILINTLGKHGYQAGMFEFPRGLALFSNLKLAVVSLNYKHGLQVFSP